MLLPIRGLNKACKNFLTVELEVEVVLTIAIRLNSFFDYRIESCVKETILVTIAYIFFLNLCRLTVVVDEYFKKIINMSNLLL